MVEACWRKYNTVGSFETHSSSICGCDMISQLPASDTIPTVFAMSVHHNGLSYFYGTISQNKLSSGSHFWLRCGIIAAEK